MRRLQKSSKNILCHMKKQSACFPRKTGGLLSRKTFWQFDYLAVGQQGDLIAKYLYWLVVRKSTLL
jgi:hypothetical protein